MATEPQFFTVENVLTSILALGAIYAIVDSRLSKRKYSDDRIKEKERHAVEHGIQEERIENMKNSLDHAHDKIRDMGVEFNEINMTVVRIKDSIEEQTRVLRKIELFIEKQSIETAKIQQRIKEL